MAVTVGPLGGDALWTRSGPEGSSRSNSIERRGRVGRPATFVNITVTTVAIIVTITVTTPA